MEQGLIEYFQGEKIGSLIALVTGVGGVMVGFWLLIRVRYTFFRGVAYPMMIIALWQLENASTVYFKIDGQASYLLSVIHDVSTSYEELDRMDRLMQRFQVQQWIDGGLILLGFLLFASGSNKGFWKGVGLGVMIQASIMMTFDLLSERRAETYSIELKKENTIIV